MDNMLAPGQQYTVLKYGRNVSPHQTIKITIYWIGLGYVHYREEGCSTMQEMSVHKLIEIIKQ